MVQVVARTALGSIEIAIAAITADAAYAVRTNISVVYFCMSSCDEWCIWIVATNVHATTPKRTSMGLQNCTATTVMASAPHTASPKSGLTGMCRREAVDEAFESFSTSGALALVRVILMDSGSVDTLIEAMFQSPASSIEIDDVWDADVWDACETAAAAGAPAFRDVRIVNCAARDATRVLRAAGSLLQRATIDLGDKPLAPEYDAWLREAVWLDSVDVIGASGPIDAFPGRRDEGERRLATRRLAERRATFGARRVAS